MQEGKLRPCPPAAAKGLRFACKTCKNLENIVFFARNETAGRGGRPSKVSYTYIIKDRTDSSDGPEGNGWKSPEIFPNFG